MSSGGAPNYVERIERGLRSRGGSGDEELVLIDGARRDDCSARDDLLECCDDPQPTPEAR